MKRNLDKNMSCHFWTPLRKQEKKKNSKVPLMSYLQKTGSKRRRKPSDDMKMQQNSPTQEKIHKYINKLSSAKLHF